MYDMSLSEKVYHYLTLIPRGRVVTYSQIGEALGNRYLARAIGNILHVNPDPIGCPCFKVVNSKGELARNFGSEGGIETQKKRLEADGVKVTDYKVDLSVYQWNGK